MKLQPGSIRRQWALAVLLSFTIAMAFQGSRGIFEPDEGFYTNVALGMAESGDWVMPRLNGDPFLDKPPLLYWGIGWGVRLFGTNEWAARAAQALWFVATSILVGLFARRLWGPDRGPLGVAVYSATLGPVVAASVLTPDTILGFWATFLVYAYWRYFTSSDRRARWTYALLLGLGVGGGVLAKGPAILLFLPPIAVHLVVTKGVRGALKPELFACAALSAVVGGSWYLAVGSQVPGAWAYWFDNQIAGRLWSAKYHRSPQWWGGLVVYSQFLLAGGLPWWPLWIWRWVRRGDAESAGQSGAGRPVILLLRLWFLLPLAVLLLASSRLLLYALPLMAPLALATTEILFHRPFAAWRLRRVAVTAVAWVVVLITLKGLTSLVPSHRNSREVAEALGRVGTESSTTIVAVDTKQSGLRFYGFPDIVNTRYSNPEYPYFVPIRSLRSLAEGGDLPTSRFVVVANTGRRGIVSRVFEEIGFGCENRPAIYDLEFLECRPRSTNRNLGDSEDPTGRHPVLAAFKTARGCVDTGDPTCRVWAERLRRLLER
ncbi:MAG: ArnT family glycosyltransferase [Thermoanaerobaculia bacterium]